jgi:hypothetical protein
MSSRQIPVQKAIAVIKRGLKNFSPVSRSLTLSLQLVLRYSRTMVSSRNYMPMKLVIILCRRQTQPIAPGNAGTVKTSLAF